MADNHTEMKSFIRILENNETYEVNAGDIMEIRFYISVGGEKLVNVFNLTNTMWSDNYRISRLKHLRSFMDEVVFVNISLSSKIEALYYKVRRILMEGFDRGFNKDFNMKNILQ